MMSKHDPYFRFPLAALSFNCPVTTLSSIMDYGVVSAGRGARFKMGNAFTAHAEMAVTLCGWTWPADPRWFEPLEDIAVGSQLCEVEGTGWQSVWGKFKTLESHVQRWCEASGDTEAFVTMKAEWVWQAYNTARIAEGVPPSIGCSSSDPHISWREFTVLCAVLSVIGKKPFAYISSTDIAHRACGYTSAAAWKRAGETGTEHLPALKRWQINDTLCDLEKNRFFLRARVSRGNTGGRTAYSIRHATRKSLWQAMRTQRDRREGRDIIDNRREDQALQSEVYFQSLIS